MCTLYEASAAAAMLHTQNGGKRDASQHGSESSKFKSSAATYTVDEGPPVASARRATATGMRTLLPLYRAASVTADVHLLYAQSGCAIFLQVLAERGGKAW
ncbi:hypothetical protein NUW58_g522 [Xylaria curta]|uniref:Uncharacterized protein n=1 Tax=Xylaria curta TaxID=42375 RepID=A0ACC1PQQ0_9PEZI|nr:hypothetical protein NUW58_g522 [Xylaria curta]